MNRLRILTFISTFIPGYKGGGPIRTIANLTDWFGDEFTFLIVTSDRDIGDAKPYRDVLTERWQRVGKADVFYQAPQAWSLSRLRRLLNNTAHDMVYLNSFFWSASIKIVLLHRLKLIPAKPILLAPRGEFSAGALSLKSYKKKPFIALAKLSGLYDSVRWQASSEYERHDILRTVRPRDTREDVTVSVAPNLPPRYSGVARVNPVAKRAGAARIIFLSRITRKKNLDFALHLLSQTKGEVDFDIYGPIEDQKYWDECQTQVEQLPNNARVTYRGAVPPDQTTANFSQYHLFLFPTRGENFGHVILEALSAGCPVLVSDQTPWRALEAQHAGWDISLADEHRFVSALDQIVCMEDSEFQLWSQGARNIAARFVHDPTIVDSNRRLFLEVAGNT